MTAHAVTGDRSDAFLDVAVEVLLNKLDELLRDVAVHAVVVRVSSGRRVDVEAGASAKIPVLVCWSVWGTSMRRFVQEI